MPQQLFWMGVLKFKVGPYSQHWQRNLLWKEISLYFIFSRQRHVFKYKVMAEHVFKMLPPCFKEKSFPDAIGLDLKRFSPQWLCWGLGVLNLSHSWGVAASEEPLQPLIITITQLKTLEWTICKTPPISYTRSLLTLSLQCFFFTDGQVEVDKSRSFAATVTAALPVGRFYYL